MKRWTEREEEYLKQHYPSEPFYNLMKTLNRSPHSILKKAGRMGLRRKEKFWINPNKSPIGNFSDVDIAYCAGLIDGEGTIRLQFSKTYKGEWTYPRITVSNTFKDVIVFLQTRLGGYIVKTKRCSPITNKRIKDLYTLQIDGIMTVLTILRRIEKFLIVKKDEARRVLSWCERALEEEHGERGKGAYQLWKLLKRKGKR